MGRPIEAQSRSRILKDLLLGICLGGAVAALVWYFWKEPPAAVREAALGRQQALLQSAQQTVRQQAAPSPAAQPPVRRAVCDFEPLIPPAAAPDGHAAVEHPFPAGPRARAKVFVRAAEAAAAMGRRRDAEVALIAACAENEKAAARPTVPLARVLGTLGERYAAAGAAEHSAEVREQLLARARHVLTLSAQAYETALGPKAPGSRQARQRLAALEQDVLAADADVMAPDAQEPRNRPLPGESARPGPQQPHEPAPAAVARAAPAPRHSVDPPPVRQRADAEPAPAAAAVGADPQLRQLASDLARLRAQAEAVSEDPAGLRRRTELARAQRDQCQDAACLRAWYARRRQELLAEF